MIVRVQSSKGTRKIEVSETDNYEALLRLVAREFGLDLTSDWFLSNSRKECDKLRWKITTALSKLGLKHGDLIYLLVSQKGKGKEKSQLDVDQNVHHGDGSRRGSLDRDTSSRTAGSVILEDKIDQDLSKMDGQIKRKRNEQFCHHPPAGQCIHCVPLEPYNPSYLEHLDPPVKFMPFHAYLRKLSGGQGRGKFVTLENLSYRVRPGCREHPPWPDGICTKCQPNPVTLDVQSYRHVDYVQFENAQLMDNFLDFWRQTGRQRIGILLGRYAHFDTPSAPPLAIKAVVAEIYEPPQESTERSVQLTAPLDRLLPPHTVAVAEHLGLRPVGWIFTDLVAAESSKGTVKHYRGTMDSFFLSAEECITAAHLQNLHPNICKHSPDGCFGSKFVTVVVTGDSSNQIHLEGYQVSNQGMALERDHVLVPTFDAPELGYIRETTKEQFVPEVFYTSTDKYGNKVTRIARPLPIEYLLVDMPAAFPVDPVYILAKQPANLPTDCRFPVENRESLGQIQNFPTFARLLRHLGNDDLYTCLSNFHLLVWLAGNDSLPLGLLTGPTDPDNDQRGMSGLLKALALAANGSISAAQTALDQWAADSPAWATVKELADTVAGDMSPGTSSVLDTNPFASQSHDITKVSSIGVDTSASAIGIRPNSSTSQIPNQPVNQPIRSQPSNPTADHWACSHCTFHNRLDSAECEMCRLPRLS